MLTVSWTAANGIIYIVGNLFTYGFEHIESDVMYMYQIMFLLCGLLTVFYAFVALVFVPDSPLKTKYFTERENAIAERLMGQSVSFAGVEGVILAYSLKDEY